MSNNSFKVKNSLTLTPVDLSQVVNPQAGDLACDINDSNKIKRYDANSAAWTEVGSGGVGGTDILFVQDFESASLSSFTQTGLSLSQTDPLHGKVSALLTHQAAVNQSFKQVIAVDRKFRGEAMTMRLNVKSNAPAGDVTINIYDETNAANLVASEQLQLANDTSGVLNRIGFTIPETCASLSYTITALPEAGSPVTRVDDIIAELAVTSLLETSVEVPVVTSWQGYTPTFTGFGTPSAVEFEWRQVGQDVEIRGKFTSGTSTAVEARISLPNGYTSAATDLIPSIQVAGSVSLYGVVGSVLRTPLVEPNVSYLTFGAQESGSIGLAKLTGSGFLNSSTTVSFTAKVPCAGLSATTTKTIALTQSGLVQEGDSYLRAIGSAGQSITASVTNIPFSTPTVVGSDIQFDGSSVTVLADGVYALEGMIDFAASLVRTVELYVNGTLYRRISDINATNDKQMFSYSDYFVAGSVLSLRVGANGGTLENSPTSIAHFLTVSKQGSLKQVSVSSDQKITIPTSELRFEGASSRGAVATAIVRFDTVAKIRGDAFTVTSTANDGTFVTMTKAGKLSISSTIQGSSTALIGISRNQANLTSNVLTASEVMSAVNPAVSEIANMSWDGFVSVGDIFRVFAIANPVVYAGNNFSLSFQEQDISVSVTNTLPQFSDSDSSVRVDGGNGFGSTATQIRRFSNIRDNIGVDVEYADSAANGATFTVKSDGVYSISFTDTTQTNGANIGISKNSTQLTTSIDNINAADRLGLERSLNLGITETMNVSWTGYLNAGDIIRPHTSAQSTSVVQAALFTVTKQGKPNVTGVDVTAFVNVPQPTTQSSYITFGSNFSGDFVGALTSSNGSGVYSYSTSTGVYTMLKPGSVTLSAAIRNTAAALVGIRILVDNVQVASDYTPANAGAEASTGYSTTLQAGQTFKFQSDGTVSLSNTRASVVATANSDQILTASESFSTDTASLTYAPSSLYTLSTLNTAPVGTFITFTYAINTNTRTQTTTAPTQTTASMNANGIQVFTRAYNAASTAASPAVVAIQIGKGLKGLNLGIYKSLAKVTAGEIDYVQYQASGINGIRFKNYDELTGILYVDAAFCELSSVTSSAIRYSDQTEQTNGYLVINASKSPALVGVPLLQPRIATLSDVKASGTEGGTATAGAYATRTLNTLSDPTGIVTSLASNQFTLPAGEYYIEAVTPGYFCENFKSKLRNITDSTDALIGGTINLRSTGTGDNAAQVMAYSPLRGNLVINSAKTFEIQMRVGVTVATFGFGIASAFGDSEVYTVCQITKIK